MRTRADGALEHEIMTVLWRADRPLPPGEIKSQLAAPLAYTSVATVLVRLHGKGIVRRHQSGRAFVYEPAIGEAELATRRIDEVLSSVSDRDAVLAGFVRTLSANDARAVRALLEGSER